MRRVRTGAAALACTLLTLAYACGGSTSGGGPTPTGAAVPIGPQGGTVTACGAALVVPQGALDVTVALTITCETPASVAGYELHSPLFRFEPAGLYFATPATIAIPFTGPPDHIDIFWSSEDEATYAPIGATVEGSVLVGTVNHFSSGFVGEAVSSAADATTDAGPVAADATMDRSADAVADHTHSDVTAADSTTDHGMPEASFDGSTSDTGSEDDMASPVQCPPGFEAGSNAPNPTCSSDAGTSDGCSGSYCTDPSNCGEPNHDCLGASCANGFCTPTPLYLGTFSVPIFCSAAAVDDTYIYVADSNGLERVPKAGGPIVNMYSSPDGSPGICAVATDSTNVYWTIDGTALYVLPKDGGSPSELSPLPSTVGASLAVDDAAAWTAAHSNMPEALFRVPLANPDAATGLCGNKNDYGPIFSTGDYAYYSSELWTSRCPSNGGPEQDFEHTGQSENTPFALDAVNYYAFAGSGLEVRPLNAIECATDYCIDSFYGGAPIAMATDGVSVYWEGIDGTNLQNWCTVAKVSITGGHVTPLIDGVQNNFRCQYFPSQPQMFVDSSRVYFIVDGDNGAPEGIYSVPK